MGAQRGGASRNPDQWERRAARPRPSAGAARMRTTRRPPSRGGAGPGRALRRRSRNPPPSAPAAPARAPRVLPRPQRSPPGALRWVWGAARRERPRWRPRTAPPPPMSPRPLAVSGPPPSWACAAYCGLLRPSAACAPGGAQRGPERPSAVGVAVVPPPHLPLTPHARAVPVAPPPFSRCRRSVRFYSRGFGIGTPTPHNPY